MGSDTARPHGDADTTTPGAAELARRLRERLGADPPESLVEFLLECSDCAKVLSPEGRIRYANDAAVETLARADLEGQFWWDLWPECDQILLREAVGSGARGASLRLQLTWRAPDGTVHRFDVILRPIARGEHREIAGLLVVLNARQANRDESPGAA